MPVVGQGELLLIRHAPADHGGRLCGRRDVPALLPSGPALAPLRALLEGVTIVASPARRCVQTAEALSSGGIIETDDRLWEQDFGAWEDIPIADLPDLGPLSPAQLATHRPSGGESFGDMAARAAPALRALGERARTTGGIAVVAHAGTVRAAIGLALGQVGLGLAFEIAPLSVTRLRHHPEGVAIMATNTPFAVG